MKECPFCGSMNVAATHNKKQTRFYVICNSCNARGPDSRSENTLQPSYAIARGDWDRREQR